MLRHFFLALCGLAVIGCGSGFTGLSAVNNTTGKVSLTANDQPSIEIPPNATANTKLSWPEIPPEQFKVHAKLADGKILDASWPSRSYPASTREGGSAVVEISEEKLTLREPSTGERFRENPAHAIFPLAIMVCPIATIVLIVILMFRGRRTTDAPNASK